MTGRFIRHLNIVSIESFEDSTLTKIFSSLVDWHFNQGFEAIFNRLGKVWCEVPRVLSVGQNLTSSLLFLLSQVMVQATMGVYKAAVSTFLPTPSKSHYVFNLRDFSRVVRGVLLVPKTHMKEGDKLTRLWVHEIYRVFYDRLVDDNDRCVRREEGREGEVGRE